MSQKSKKPEQKLIFSTNDPQSRVVSLTTSTWDHIKDHPEIKRVGLHRVKNIVVNPLYIIYNEPRSALTYTDYTGSSLFINVFAKMDDNLKEAYISTAYLTTTMPHGEVIWQKQPQKKKKKRKKSK